MLTRFSLGTVLDGRAPACRCELAAAADLDPDDEVNAMLVEAFDGSVDETDDDAKYRRGDGGGSYHSAKPVSN